MGFNPTDVQRVQTDADLKKFLDFHRVDPDYYGYKMFIFSMTAEQEKQIMDRIEVSPNTAGGWCSSSVSDAISGIGSFKDLNGSMSPGNLADQLQNIVSPLRPTGGHK